MKRIKFLVILLLILIGYLSSAQDTIWVSNRDDNTIADYSNLQTAIDNANSGDVIMIYPSPTSYGNINVIKRLHLKGGGYLLSRNYDQIKITTETESTLIGHVTIQNVSQGSINNLSMGDLLLEADNFLVNGCLIEFMELRSSSEIILTKNYFNSYKRISTPAAYTTIALSGNNTSIIFNNNIFDVNDLPSNVQYRSVIYAPNASDIPIIAGVQSGFILNNAQFYNNIAPNIAGSGIISTNNIIISDLNDIFVGYPSQGSHSFDGKYNLSDTSPAKGAASDGGDCGAFGGDTPYVLSGLGKGPIIYHLDVPATISGSFLDVNIKVKSHE